MGVNTRYNVEEATHVIDLARPVVIAIAHGFAGLDLGKRLTAAAAASSAPLPSIAVIAGPHRDRASAVEAAAYDLGAGVWVPSGNPHTGPYGQLTDTAGQLAVAFTTSGSTGRPKLAAHTVGAVADHARACASAAGWAADSVTLSALPLTGVFSFVPAMATIAAGGVCLLEPSFDADAIVADMERHGVTHVVGADDIVGRLVDAARLHKPDLSRWQRLLMADFNGRSEELARWAETELGLVASGVYGSSELFALASLWPPETPAPLRWRGGGRLVHADIAVRVGDPETGSALPGGETGELQFRGPNVVDAYLGNPALREAVLTPDGWFRSGDLGFVMPDGSFEYQCRIGDVLRLKGFLVEPIEIENRLAAHPAVAMNKVVGVRDAKGETAAIGFAVLHNGHQAASAELVAWCAAALARYKVPRIVHVIREMPVTSGVNGTKVRASELRAWATALDCDPSFLISINNSAGP